jgi:triacylglycerol lipase
MPGCADSATSSVSQHERQASRPVAAAVPPNSNPLTSKLTGRPTQYPIVLVHGFDDAAAKVWVDTGVNAALTADGHTVYLAELPPLASVERRAAALQKCVDRALQDQVNRGVHEPKVNLIAHSMGGLDSRELISVLGYADRVASLTTLSAPHRGSAIADFTLDVLPGWAAPALNAFASAYARSFTSADLAAGSDLWAMLLALSEASADDFNARHPDDARVYYQSYAGVSSVFGLPNDAVLSACEGQLPSAQLDAMSPQLVAAAPFVSHFADRGELLPNDGLVLVTSAKWGIFRGCVSADHLKETGKMAADPRTGFDHLRLFRTIAFDLASAGF